MSSPPAQPLLLTYDDYCAMPADGQRYELLEGELYVVPAPMTRHQRVSRNLEFVLHAYVSAQGLGEVLNAPVDVILDRRTVVQPDLLFVSHDRLGIITERAVEGPPDLAVEILSEHGAARDLGYKHQLYARHGVQHYWVVDPDGKSLAEHVLSERAYALRGTYVAGATCTAALFPELAIDLQAVFH